MSLSSKQKLKDWRAEQIAKVFLYRSSFDLNIDDYPTHAFDFYITQAGNPKIRFAVEVMLKNTFGRSIQQQWSHLATYKKDRMMNMPAIIIKVDEPNETAEFDFLVTPSTTGRLFIKKQYAFKKLTPETLDAFIGKIKAWWKLNDEMVKNKFCVSC